MTAHVALQCEEAPPYNDSRQKIDCKRWVPCWRGVRSPAPPPNESLLGLLLALSMNSSLPISDSPLLATAFATEELSAKSRWPKPLNLPSSPYAAQNKEQNLVQALLDGKSEEHQWHERQAPLAFQSETCNDHLERCCGMTSWVQEYARRPFKQASI